jgi:hypothetical protein
MDQSMLEIEEQVISDITAMGFVIVDIDLFKVLDKISVQNVENPLSLVLLIVEESLLCLR